MSIGRKSMGPGIEPARAADSLHSGVGPGVRRRAGDVLWRQLADLLLARIDEGRLGPGALLPSENQLMEEFGVSRNTVRRALLRLRELGKIDVEQGRGAFVRQPRFLQYTITDRTRFADILAEQGYAPRVQFLEALTCPAPDPVAELLELAPGAPVHFLRAVSDADDVRISTTRIFHPAERFPEMIERRRRDINLASVYRTFGIEDYRRRVTWIEARRPTEEEADLLKQDIFEPVMVTRKVDVDQQGRPIEFSEALWSGSHVRLCIPGAD